jgi:hypothetical protein
MTGYALGHKFSQAWKINKFLEFYIGVLQTVFSGAHYIVIHKRAHITIILKK